MGIQFQIKNGIENVFKKEILSHVPKLILPAKMEYMVPETLEISLVRERTSQQLIFR